MQISQIVQFRRTSQTSARVRHAKGMDQTMIDTAVATALLVTISPKFWAEHMGLPYRQANIPELEKPRLNRGGLMSFSAGPRNFLRYG